MLDAVRFKLLFGPYRMPRCRIGRWRRCAHRGEVKVVGISDASISWPQCKAGKHLIPILCDGLIKAVKRESNLAVAHHWGVSRHTVSLWRKGLGVPPLTDGTRRLFRDWTPERLTDEVRERTRKSCQSPEFSAKQSPAQTGRPMPAAARKALLRANTNRKASAQAKAKMSAAHRRIWDARRDAGEAWQPAWDALLGTAPDKTLAARLGVYHETVYKRRMALGIPSHRPHAAVTPPVDEDGVRPQAVPLSPNRPNLYRD